MTTGHMIVAEYFADYAPRFWGPYDSAAAAETDRLYLELTVFSRHEHFKKSYVDQMARPLAPRPAPQGPVPPPPPLQLGPQKARRSRRYRAKEGFALVYAGEYLWKIGHGYTGRVRKNGRGEWAGYVMQGADIAKTDAGVLCAFVTTTKDAAEVWVQARAREITYETYNMLNQKAGTFRLPITTPHCCDPSTETYHCM